MWQTKRQLSSVNTTTLYLTVRRTKRQLTLPIPQFYYSSLWWSKRQSTLLYHHFIIQRCGKQSDILLYQYHPFTMQRCDKATAYFINNTISLCSGVTKRQLTLMNSTTLLFSGLADKDKKRRDLLHQYHNFIMQRCGKATYYLINSITLLFNDVGERSTSYFIGTTSLLYNGATKR